MGEQIERVLFTEDMKKTHTILIPDMLPRHFKLITALMRNYGYNMELLQNNGAGVTENGLKYVHNDSCYPAQLVIGQFLDAIQSGKYDPKKVALLLTQTGGGCRASNYISLLRKALARAGYGYVPIISLNFSGLESNPGFKITMPILRRLVYAILYGDLMMRLVNQCRPYEIVKGSADELADKWTSKIARSLVDAKIVRYKNVREDFYSIVKDFSELPCIRTPKTRVGIVGEIYVKFSPLGNNRLEDFLVEENCEPVLAGLIDFVMYCVYNSIADYKLYRRGAMTKSIYSVVYKYLLKKQHHISEALTSTGVFRGFCDFDHTRSLIDGYLGIGMKMGEGWLLTAEMLELIDDGVNNIVCVQPFGCLPNHIAGRGVIHKIKEAHPEANIAAIDYDPSTSPVNQHNRIKLMLSNMESVASAPQEIEKTERAASPARR